ncbi:MAG: hypothetical protein BGO86_01310 [Chryseobacterium sp. 36-9]|nr:MAG: hypothetical protein BGO86_01310 [Chryseobacterium sp. 36-9]
MKLIKNLFDYLFYKYYHFQILVGNGDRAFVMAILSLTFISFLYLSSIIMIFLFFIPTKITINPLYGVILLSIIFLMFYLLFSHRKRYISIINDTKFKTKNNFPVIFLSIFSC